MSHRGKEYPCDLCGSNDHKTSSSSHGTVMLVFDGLFSEATEYMICPDCAGYPLSDIIGRLTNMEALKQSWKRG